MVGGAEVGSEGLGTGLGSVGWTLPKLGRWKPRRARA